MLGRLLRDEEARADLPVCQAALHQLEDLDLAPGQLGGRALVRAMRSGRNVADACPAHALAKPIGSGHRPESGEDLEGPAHRGLGAFRAHEGVDGAAQTLAGRRLGIRQDPGQQGGRVPPLVALQLEQDRRLVGEVLVERADADAGALG